MTSRGEADANPLSRIALQTPPWAAQALSAGARLAGAALAIYVSTDESYDRTQVFVAGLAALSIASLLPLRNPAAALVSALAGGLLVFAGAALAKETPALGVALVVAGALAAMGALAVRHRQGETLIFGLVAFFVALPVMVAAVAAIAVLVEG
jgi:hypothetical protein